MADWLRASRLLGVLKYHVKIVGRLVVWALLIVLGVQVISLALPQFTGDVFLFDGIRANFEIVFFAALVAGILTAGRSSRFLLGFGTSRTAVWIGSELALPLWMVGLLLGTFLINMLAGAALFPLQSLSPKLYAMASGLYQSALSEGLQGLPELLTYTLEWTAIFYLYGCLLRRFRVLTISVSVGVPLLFVILMLIPAVREGLSVIRGNNQGQILVLGLQWLQILNDILRFLEEHWDAVQLTAALTSLPVSYLVMRGTKQP